MMKIQIPLKFACLALLAVVDHCALAGTDCGSYPYNRGSDIIAVDGSAIPKIISTARVAPASDDISDVDDARDEATLNAKAEIAKFMSELVSSEEVRNKAIDRMAVVDGENRQALSITVDQITKSFSSQSKAMLRGVVVLGDCYTPGKEVRVTVGLKPETLAKAAGLADAVSTSLDKSPAPVSNGAGRRNSGVTSGSAPTSTDGTKIRKSDGYSNSEKLEKF